MNWKEHISSNSDILMGKPAIKGTRLSVEFLIGRLANGWTEQMLLDNYPRLTQQDLQAIFAYIQDCLRDSLLYEISTPKNAA